MENEAARILATQGFDIEQTPDVPGSKNPDYRIEERIFDCIAPTTTRTENIYSRIENKLKKGQTQRVLLYLKDNPTNIEALRERLIKKPIPGLKEVMVLTHDGVTVHLFP